MGRVAAIVATLLALAPGSADASVVKCPAAGHARAEVVVIWSPAGNEAECRWFASRGYRARVVNAPPGLTWEDDWCYLLRRVRAVARPRYLYGWSRAGTITAHLALLGEADGAIAAGPPTDLTRWWAEYPDYWESMGMTVADRRWFSPLFNVPEGPRVPLLLAHSPDDDVVPLWHSRELHREVRGSRFVRLEGRHGVGVAAVRRATLRWLREEVRRSARTGGRDRAGGRATRRCAQ